MTPQQKYEIEMQRREDIENRDVLLAISAIISTPEGRKLFKYLFKSLEVMELPPLGLDERDQQERLGFLRAGNSIYKLACVASSEITSTILADVERKRYEDKLERFRIEQLTSTTDDSDS